MKPLVFILLYAVVANAWLPDDHGLFDKRRRLSKPHSPYSRKIRGVNLGSLFVVEPWMIPKEWANMGCEGTNSEFDFVKALGQRKSEQGVP